MDKDTQSSRHMPFPESYWLEHSVPAFSRLTEDTTTEVGVVGGGIVGIMTAYLLAKAGKQVSLVEARKLLNGVTGHTTAKITAQHNLLYDDLIQTFGEESARLYYEANRDGSELIQALVQELNIDCGLEKRDAVVFSTSDKYTQKIEAEARAYETLGIKGILSYGPIDELPFPVESALMMPNQAQFHPVQFLSFLIEEIIQMGGQIYEHTRAVQLSHARPTIEMENGTTVTCKKVVVATHYPFNDFDGLYLSKLSISRSYAIAAKIDAPVPQAMYISAESPSRSLRSITDKYGEDWLLIGGDDHQTGKSSSPTHSHYRNLEAFGERWFDLQEVSHYWSAQDMETLDQVPYISQMSNSSSVIFVATGFNKWGMAAGAMAGRLLTDSILELPNRYKALYNPLRSKMKMKDVQQFVKKNTSVAKDLVTTKVGRPSMTPDDLKLDQGGLVKVHGKKAGGYRDAHGELHLVDTSCTHMGCGIRWNDAERSWDCPCHGSRFTYKGDVLNGPAVEPLKPIVDN